MTLTDEQRLAAINEVAAGIESAAAMRVPGDAKDAIARLTVIEADAARIQRMVAALVTELQERRAGERWHGVDETPEPGRKIIVLYADGSGAILAYAHDAGMLDSDGDEFEFNESHGCWAYLPEGFRLWCEDRATDPLTLPPRTEPWQRDAPAWEGGPGGLRDYRIGIATAAIRALAKEPGPADAKLDALVEYMVSRFLQWSLPSDFSPDGGISFQRVGNAGTPHEYTREPVGTNLFNAEQAEAMVRFLLDGSPLAGARP